MHELATRRAITVFAASKLLVVAALIAGRLFYFTPLHPWSYLVYTDQTAGLWLAFINWDGQHYLRLALDGYPVPPGPSSAFYPLFPALIALVMSVGPNPIAAGLIVVTLASAAVFVLAERLLPQDERGPSSLWLFACFPTAFYLSVVYAESVFLVALLGLLVALRTPGRAGWALVCAILLPLTHGQGLWLAIPIVATWLVLGLGGTAVAQTDARRLGAATLGYAIGVVGYLGFFAWRYGDPLAGIRAQEVFVFKNSVANLFDYGRFIHFLLTPPGRFLDTANSGLDKLMMAVSFIALLAGARRNQSPFLLALWIAFALLPAMMGEGGSYARHALLAWACFCIAAGPRLGSAVKWPLIAAGFALQIYLAFCFGANRWVG